MGKRYLLDTNAVIYLLKGNIKIVNPAIIVAASSEVANLSIISKIELLGWKTSDEVEMAQCREFVKYAAVLPLTDAIAEITIELRQLPNKPKLPDCIIAATAIHHNFVLITRNEKDFLLIPQLEVINPFDVTV